MSLLTLMTSCSFALLKALDIEEVEIPMCRAVSAKSVFLPDNGFVTILPFSIPRAIRWCRVPGVSSFVARHPPHCFVPQHNSKASKSKTSHKSHGLALIDVPSCESPRLQSHRANSDKPLLLQNSGLYGHSRRRQPWPAWKYLPLRYHGPWGPL